MNYLGYVSLRLYTTPTKVQLNMCYRAGTCRLAVLYLFRYIYDCNLSINEINDTCIRFSGFLTAEYVYRVSLLCKQ